jgi:hypothetical protein
MADWLPFWFTPTGALTALGVLIAYLALAYPYFKGELKDDRNYRVDAADALTTHPWATTYHERVERALAWLDDHMGRLGSWRGAGQGLVVEAVQRPCPNGLWVLIMLLSTLVPTALHAMVLVASPLMVWLRSDQKRLAIAKGLRATDPEPRAIRKASWHLVRTWVIGITAPLALAAAFVIAIGEIWRPIGDVLLGAAHRGMAGAFYVANGLGWVPPQ